MSSITCDATASALAPCSALSDAVGDLRREESEYMLPLLPLLPLLDLEFLDGM
jgi:hypothetical protein